MNHKFFVSCVFAGLSGVTGAQGVVVAGEGLVTCGAYLQSRQTGPSPTQDYIYATWVRGYLSGFNMATSGRPVPTISSPETILAYLDKHCRANPLNTLAQGVVALTGDIGGSR